MKKKIIRHRISTSRVKSVESRTRNKSGTMILFVHLTRHQRPCTGSKPHISRTGCPQHEVSSQFEIRIKSAHNLDAFVSRKKISISSGACHACISVLFAKIFTCLRPPGHVSRNCRNPRRNVENVFARYRFPAATTSWRPRMTRRAERKSKTERRRRRRQRKRERTRLGRDQRLADGTSIALERFSGFFFYILFYYYFFPRLRVDVVFRRYDVPATRG